MQTVVHVTHEAIQKIGGIGAVLHGLLTSPVYLAKRPAQHPRRPVLARRRATASSASARRARSSTAASTRIYRSPLAARFREIEQAFDVGIIYGRRRFVDKDTGVISTPEVLLIDVSRYDAEEDRRVQVRAVEEVRHRQQQVRAHLGLRAVHAPGRAGDRRAARAGRAAAPLEPCVILSHEYMGMPDGAGGDPGEATQTNFRTIFYAHEVAHDAPHRRRPPRPRHDVLQRHARGHGRRGITSKTCSATSATTTSTRW